MRRVSLMLLATALVVGTGAPAEASLFNLFGLFGNGGCRPSCAKPKHSCCKPVKVDCCKPVKVHCCKPVKVRCCQPRPSCTAPKA
ncbi:MAG: hypothetical protein D6725_10440, partial [Planctomycetota bacterium]